MVSESYPFYKEMEEKRSVLTGSHFISGNEAFAEGAIAAGCRFFGGYPITPSSEIAEHMSRRLPEVNGIFLQMEDELGSIAAVLGASWGGLKSMTATSGPGFSLMQENIGLGIITETPCVIANVQRGGPSTGLPTLVGQGDVMQARWGSHGPYETIAISPNSPQECFDMAIKAFNLAETYRLPVIVLMDESVGHMTEKVIIPPKEKIKTVYRKKPRVPPEKFLPYKPDKDLVPPMPTAGDGYYIHVTGLTHDERGYPVIDAETQERLIQRLIDKIKVNAHKIIDYETYRIKDADTIVVSYGISSRPSLGAVKKARKLGLKIGFIRLKTIWPFPEDFFRKISENVKHFFVVEINNGQIVREVERCTAKHSETHFIGKLGGTVHTPEEILDKIMEVFG